MRTLFLAISLIFVIFVASPPVVADSVGHPPAEVHSWVLTATTSSQNAKFDGYMGSCIEVINDGSVNVYVTSKATATNAPTNGDRFWVIYSGESRSIDVKCFQFSYIAASGTCAIRVTVAADH